MDEEEACEEVWLCCLWESWVGAGMISTGRDLYGEVNVTRAEEVVEEGAVEGAVEVVEEVATRWRPVDCGRGGRVLPSPK